MTYKLLLLSGIATAALAGATLTAAADDYDHGNTPRYDSQAEQTRALNNQALRHAQEQRENSLSGRGDDGDDADDNDDDDNAAVMPGGADDGDDADDDDDDAGPNQQD